MPQVPRYGEIELYLKLVGSLNLISHPIVDTTSRYLGMCVLARRLTQQAASRLCIEMLGSVDT